MDNVFGVGGFEGPHTSEWRSCTARSSGRGRAGAEDLRANPGHRRRPSGYEFQTADVAKVVNAQNSGGAEMLLASGISCFSFSKDASGFVGQFRADEFERDGAVQVAIPSLVDRAHAAFAEVRIDAVAGAEG